MDENSSEYASLDEVAGHSPLRFKPGSMLTFTVMDIDGVEYDVFVRPRP